MDDSQKNPRDPSYYILSCVLGVTLELHQTEALGDNYLQDLVDFPNFPQFKLKFFTGSESCTHKD